MKTPQSQDYCIIDKVENPTPAIFSPHKTQDLTSDAHKNVNVVIERILHPESFMLKKGTVQTVDTKGFDSWSLTCDEGSNNKDQSAPNPLSYLTVGITSNLLTQVKRGAQVLDLTLKNVTVEGVVTFRYSHGMTKNWAGFADSVEANIIIESDEPTEKLQELQALALRGWVAGSGLINSTEINPHLIVNGEFWDTNQSAPGEVVSDVSMVNNFKVTQRAAQFSPEIVDPGPDLSAMGKITKDVPAEGFDMKFNVVAIAESANDLDKPYLQKVTIRSIQENYVAWEVYVDDSEAAEGIKKGPSSLEYLTAGTGLCLTSQLPPAMMATKTPIEDYRVEQQFNIREENTFTKDMAGYVDSIDSYIMLKSQASEEELTNFFNLALQMCFAGEAFKNPTETTSHLYVNKNKIN